MPNKVTKPHKQFRLVEPTGVPTEFMMRWMQQVREKLGGDFDYIENLTVVYDSPTLGGPAYDKAEQVESLVLGNLSSNNESVKVMAELPLQIAARMALRI